MERLGDRVLVIVAGRLAASGDFRAIRRLMTDRPHTFSIASSDNRGLARELIADEGVTGVNVEEERITIHTADFERVTHRIPVIARDAGITITSLSPLDESLESVFEYLIQQ
jgi:ABC-2 type transport system ATP-binding protein